MIEDSRDAKETLSPSTKFITVPVDGKPVTIPVADFYEVGVACGDGVAHGRGDP